MCIRDSGKEGKIKINAKVESSYNSRTITPEFADGYSYAMLMNCLLYTSWLLNEVQNSNL